MRVLPDATAGRVRRFRRGRTGVALAAGALIASVLSLGAPSPAAPAPTGTTADRTIVAGSGDPSAVGFVFGPGEETIVPGRYSTKGLRSLVSFVQLTDVHVTDEESAARLEFLRFVDSRFAGAYRPNESLSAATLEALVEAAGEATSPVSGAKPSFAVATGDGADSQQYNEVGWFKSILDGGGTVSPDTGLPGYQGVRGAPYYEPFPASPRPNGFPNLPVFPNVDLLTAAQQPFAAVGLGMPWYAGFGNHDALVQGNVPLAYVGQGGDEDALVPVPAPLRGHVEIPNGSYQAAATGSTKLLGIPTSKPAEIPALLQEIIADPTAALSDPRLVPFEVTVPPDPSRCYLAKVDNAVPGLPSPPAPCAGTSFTHELAAHGFTPTANPFGYGWPAAAIANHDGYYSFQPAPGFRFVMLDTIADECGAAAQYLCDFGSLDTTQFAWFAAQLAAAHLNGERVVVLSHHPLDELAAASTDPSETWVAPALVNQVMCASGDVVAAVAGHTHDNRVAWVGCNHKRGFVRVQTAAGSDWPQQARMIEVVENQRHQLAVVLTMIDQKSPPAIDTAAATLDATQLASISRVIAYKLAGGAASSSPGTAADRNVLVPIDAKLHR